MAQPRDHLSDLDRHVQLLESKVNKLRASLDHWQQWYLEYSALKEEVEQLPRDPPPNEELRRIRRDFDGKLLTKKEINEILGKNDLKKPDQIVGVLSRRIDYVEQNINSLRKILEKEENKLAAATVVAQPDGATDEESGLPITDIIEELDENDNVISSRLQRGADAEPQIIEALKKAGIQEHELPETEADLAQAQQAPADGAKEGEAEQATPDAAANATSPPESTPPNQPAGAKKSVSFAEDTKPGHEAAEPPRSRAAQELERLMQKAREQEAMDMSTAVIPEDESPEDSQLRREMLEYSMSEIGPVVAELQLEEDYSGEDDEDDLAWDDSDEEYDDTDDDSSDDLGRSKRSVITPAYIRRMQELEKRLGVQSAFTVGRSETKPKKADEGIGRISVVPDSSSPNTTAPTAAPRKKSVSFAPKLDIAPDVATQPASDGKAKPRKIVHVGDIVDKEAEAEAPSTSNAEAPPEPEQPPKRVSRFKKERAAVASPVPSSTASLPPGPPHLPASFVQAHRTTLPPAEPTPPEHQTVASTIVERPIAPDPAEPDEMDDELLYKEAAVEYNRLRNKLIQKQGGFLQQDEVVDNQSGQVPLDEELGGPKRMSRFKAARLSKLQ